MYLIVKNHLNIYSRPPAITFFYLILAKKDNKWDGSDYQRKNVFKL